MRLLDRLERRFRPWAIPHLTEVLLAGQVLVFIGQVANPSAINALVLDKALVLHGEWWRVLTFLFVPFTTNIFFILFDWYLFYLMGAALERQWGEFRYNVFLLIGYIASVAAAFLAPAGPASNAFLYGSVFLAFAFLYPDFELLLFFILPVKIKWLALITWIGYAVMMFMGDWLARALIVASVLNFLIFFAPDLWLLARSGKHRMERQAAKFAEGGQAFHRCRVCGATEISHPQEEFRYCPDCVGGPCYCSKHIHQHEHIKSRVEEIAAQGKEKPNA